MSANCDLAVFCMLPLFGMFIVCGVFNGTYECEKTTIKVLVMVSFVIVAVFIVHVFFVTGIGNFIELLINAVVEITA